MFAVSVRVKRPVAGCGATMLTLSFLAATVKSEKQSVRLSRGSGKGYSKPQSASRPGCGVQASPEETGQSEEQAE